MTILEGQTEIELWTALLKRATDAEAECFRLREEAAANPTEQVCRAAIAAVLDHLPRQVMEDAARRAIASTLGHGDAMCSRCCITDREAAALGQLNRCEL